MLDEFINTEDCPEEWKKIPYRLAKEYSGNSWKDNDNSWTYNALKIWEYYPDFYD